MINKHYEELDRLKMELDNEGLKEAIEILENKLRLSDIAIKEGSE